MVTVGNEASLPITHTGQIVFKNNKLSWSDVLVMPSLKKNILSISKLTSDNACSIEFNANAFIIKDQNQKVLARGHKKDGLYAFDDGHLNAFSAIKETTVDSDL